MKIMKGPNNFNIIKWVLFIVIYFRREYINLYSVVFVKKNYNNVTIIMNVNDVAH